MVDHGISDLLRHSVYLSLNEGDKALFDRKAREITDWETLIKEAESSGLSNLLYTHLKSCGIEIPDTHSVTFKALVARHTRSNRDRTQALLEILDIFSEHDVDCILLKGMALLQCLYTENAQRPMGDMDILVSKDQALLAQDLLRKIGYNAGDRKHGYLYDHHHLPLASKRCRGMSLQVEIHHDALSGDVNDSITYESALKSREILDLQGRQVSVLGESDMLYHLCKHTFEPIEKIKLGAIADIYGYAVAYKDSIQWQSDGDKQKLVNNTLSCLHYLSPLPRSLENVLPVPKSAPPNGIGLGFPPLSRTMNSNKGLFEKLKILFICSEWWYHIQYVVPPEKSILKTRLITHPMTVYFWFYRRIAARIKSQISTKN